MATHFSILAWEIPWTEGIEFLDNYWSRSFTTKMYSTAIINFFLFIFGLLEYMLFSSLNRRYVCNKY